MADLTKARAAQEHAFEAIRDRVGVLPDSVGIVPLSEGGYGLKVVLPFAPAGDTPDSLDSVPIEFHIGQGRPFLASSPDKVLPSWIARSRVRRAGG